METQSAGRIYLMLDQIIQMIYCQNEMLCKIYKKETIDTTLLEEIKTQLDVIQTEVEDINHLFDEGEVPPMVCPQCED